MNVAPPFRPIFASAGAQPEVGDVVGRRAEVDRLWHAVTRGSVMLNNPRRMGKTSLLLLMGERVPDGWLYTRTSIQGVQTSAELVDRVLGQIRDHDRMSAQVRQSMRQFFEQQGEVKVGTAQLGLSLRPSFRVNPLRTLEAAIESVSAQLDREQKTLVIAWDEFPDVVDAVTRKEGPDSAAAMLGVLRRFREQYPKRIRWIWTGSVGMHHVLRRLDNGSSYTTDLDSVPLGPLSEADSRYLAGCLLIGAGMPANERQIRELTLVTDGIPYLLHLLVAYARDVAAAGGHIRSTDDLFFAAIGDKDASHQSTHLLSRIPDHYGSNSPAAETILDLIAMTPSSRSGVAASLAGQPDTPEERRLREILGWLELDHYITKDASGVYAWKYNALRRIWVQRRA